MIAIRGKITLTASAGAQATRCEYPSSYRTSVLGDLRMTTTLMKTCLLGMAGAMTFSLVACGNNSSSTGTPASTTVARSSTSVTASPTPVEHEQTKAPKHLSQDPQTEYLQRHWRGAQ